MGPPLGRSQLLTWEQVQGGGEWGLVGEGLGRGGAAVGEKRERDNMTFEMSLCLWNICECSVYRSFLIVCFTFVCGLVHSLWLCKHMFLLPIKTLRISLN